MVKPFEGVLPVYKPAGFTSHDVVAKMRRILKMKRIGHTGTLDPQVTGVLPLCLGRATRVVEYMQELPKEYLATPPSSSGRLSSIPTPSPSWSAWMHCPVCSLASP